MSDWELTGTVDAATLVPARLEAHAAAQLVSVAGKSLLAPRPDDSHTSLTWTDAIGGMIGEPLPADNVRAGLRVAGMVLCLLDSELRAVDEYPLAGKTIAEARHWLAGVLTGRVSVGRALGAIELPETLAAMRPADARFVSLPAASELARYYANAARMLVRWASPGHPIRLWPHHFDIAVLLDGPKPGQTVGVGMSPGDASYSEPYWYVTPWPYPEATKLPPLEHGGSWHREQWVGAVLTASQLDRNDAARQHRQVAGFVDSAVTAVQALLDRPA